MKKCLTVILLTLIFINLSYSQSWAKNPVCAENWDAYGTRIAFDGSGNSFVTGHFYATITFGSGESNQTSLICPTFPYQHDAFVAKYNPNGTLLWAKQIGGDNDNQFGFSVATDGSGNCLVTGLFRGTVRFEPGEPDQLDLTSSAQSAMFVAKYDPTGDLIWAKSASGVSTSDRTGGYGISTDGANNIFVTGIFTNTATFGLGEANQTPLTSIGNMDIFVAKYDPTGNLIWAKRAGGTDADFANDLTVDDSGNSIITGYFKGMSTFGLSEANETTLTSLGQADIFVAKYNSNGELLWVNQAGGTSWGDEGHGVAVDATGNIFVTGSFYGNATFDTGVSITHNGETDIFIAKYNSNGSLQWVKKAGNYEPDYGRDISLDNLGNCFVTGNFYNTAIFGSGEANETTISNYDGNDIFIAKYNTNGELQWADYAGGEGADYGYGIDVDGLGNAAITGKYNADAIFFHDTVDETLLNSISYGRNEVFIAKYVFNTAPPTIEVDFDIHPTSWPNPLNVKSGGVVPTAILGTASFDVSSIDPASLTLEGVAPLRWSYEDVTGPAGTGECNETEDGPDGYIDLALKFDVQEIVAALGNVNNGDMLTLIIEGNLTGGEDIIGDDCIVIRANRNKEILIDNKQAVGLELLSNNPNPFNPETYINYKLNAETNVLIEIYDITGKHISTLFNDHQSEGTHSIKWPGKNDTGTNVPAGIYIVKVTAEDIVRTDRLMLLK